MLRLSDLVQHRIAVIGQGYVGLPLAVAAAKAGFSVLGLDNNKDKVLNLKKFISGIEGVDSKELKKITSKGNYIATDDFHSLTDVKTIMICVPTPLGNNGKPDLKFLIEATAQVARNMSRGTLVIIESTVAPGTTRNVIVPLLKSESQFENQDFTVAFSPERVDPLNNKWGIANTPKLLSALSEDGYRLAFNFYSKFINTIIKCDSIEIAETAKLLENSFRLINISFINEIAIFCRKMNIEVSEVIKAAATKPFGFMPFFPGIGIGGHCIPVDPVYLSEKAREVHAPITMIDRAVKINSELWRYFMQLAEIKLGTVVSKKILVIGISYKPNVSDVRESPAIKLIQELRAAGATVFWHDDVVQLWNKEKSTDLNENFDLAIVATNHKNLELAKLGNVPKIDTRGLLV